MSFDELMNDCRHMASHLELGDAYSLKHPVFLDRQAGREIDPAERQRGWFGLVRDVAG